MGPGPIGSKLMLRPGPTIQKLLESNSLQMIGYLIETLVAITLVERANLTLLVCLNCYVSELQVGCPMLKDFNSRAM